MANLSLSFLCVWYQCTLERSTAELNFGQGESILPQKDQFFLALPLLIDLQAYFYFPKLGRSRGKCYQLWKHSYTWNDEGYTCFYCICCSTGMSCITCAARAEYCFKARFALSSSRVFNRTNTVTDSEKFYNSVLEVLEDPDETKEVDALLAWWNRWVWFQLHSFIIYLLTNSLIAYFSPTILQIPDLYQKTVH